MSALVQVPSGSKPLSEPMLTKIYNAMMSECIYTYLIHMQLFFIFILKSNLRYQIVVIFHSFTEIANSKLCK